MALRQKTVARRAEDTAMKFTIKHGHFIGVRRHLHHLHIQSFKGMDFRF